MPLTVGVNAGAGGLTLCHKGSNGVSVATVPDVCKTPPQPLPVPYPNVAFSADLAKGTTTVKADGGNMCANYGSEFSKSTGDEPGTVGGVASGTFIKEATWITFSFDVKLEGKGACRLTDKMFHNHQNTTNAAGLIQNAQSPEDAAIIQCILQMCKKDKDIVEKARTRLTIKSETPQQRIIYRYSGGRWQAERRTTAGTANPVTKEVTISRGQSCDEIQRTMVHEVAHTEQQGMSAPEMEVDAYTKEEAWAIKRGLPGGKFRKLDAGGKAVPNVDAIKQNVSRVYGYSIPTSGPMPPQVIGTTNGGKSVILSDRTVRPVQEGDAYKHAPPNQQLDRRDIPSDSLKCP